MKKSLGYSSRNKDGVWHGIFHLEHVIEEKKETPVLIVLLEDEVGSYVACWDVTVQRFVFLDQSKERMQEIMKRAYGDALDDQHARLVGVRVIVVDV